MVKTWDHFLLYRGHTMDCACGASFLNGPATHGTLYKPWTILWTTSLTISKHQKKELLQYAIIANEYPQNINIRSLAWCTFTTIAKYKAYFFFFWFVFFFPLSSQNITKHRPITGSNNSMYKTRNLKNHTTEKSGQVMGLQWTVRHSTGLKI